MSEHAGISHGDGWRARTAKASRARARPQPERRLKTNIIAAVVIDHRDASDCRQFPALFEATTKNFTVREVSADEAYTSKDNLTLVASKGAEPYMPMRSDAKPDKRSPAWNKLYHLFAYRQEEFAAHYHKRSNVEATFSAVKRLFGDSVRSKTPVAQVNEVLLKLICHNIRVLIHEMHELGVVPEFAAERGLNLTGTR